VLLAKLVDQWRNPLPSSNPGMLSGYTYLSQFVAHDMVNTALPFWAVTGGRETHNVQRQPLRLNTLYGEGSPCARFFTLQGRRHQGRATRPDDFCFAWTRSVG